MSRFSEKISRIRTGGQTGVDRAAMDFAREHGIPLCGWCPKNGWAEDYPNPPGLLTGLSFYGLIIHKFRKAAAAVKIPAENLMFSD